MGTPALLSSVENRQLERPIDPGQAKGDCPNIVRPWTRIRIAGLFDSMLSSKPQDVVSHCLLCDHLPRASTMCHGSSMGAQDNHGYGNGPRLVKSIAMQAAEGVSSLHRC